MRRGGIEMFKQRHGIKSQLFKAQISLVLISTISFFIFSSVYLYRQNINTAYNGILHTGDLCASQINRIFAQLENTVYYVSVNSEIPSILSSSEESDSISRQKYRSIINNTWALMQSTHAYPIEFTVYARSDNQNILFDGKKFQTLDSAENESWYKLLTSSKNRMIYFNENGVFSVINKIYKNDDYTSFVGILRVFLDNSVLQSVLNTGASDYSFNLLLDNNNHIISPADGFSLTGNDIERIQKIRYADAPSSISFDDGSRYFATAHRLDNQNFCLYTLHNVNSIYHEIFVMLILLILILAVVSAAAFLMAWHRSLPLVNTFTTLSNAIKGMNLGEFKMLDIPPDTDDSIVETYSDYNSLTATVKNLIQYNSDYENNIKKMELDFLQQQIKPHFLYNTLNTMQGLVKGNDIDKTIALISSLSKFYHLSLHNSDSSVELATELMHITYYVKIENFKFNNAIRLDIDIPEDVMKCKVPKLILQPLIENAVHHGIREKSSGCGTISVTCGREGHDIYLYVTDDGVGISPQKISEIKNGHSIGYINTDRRLRLFFGQEYGLDIESIESEYTKIIIKIKDGSLHDKHIDC